ncbi:MAG: alpha/beta hydrolase [Anaerolineales bacterium]
MPSAAEIYYYAYQGGDADRPSVVLIHGAGGTHLYWPSEVRGLLGAGARLRVQPDILQNTSNETTFQSAIDQVVGCSFSEQAPERLVELAAKRMDETRPSVLHGDFLACDAFDEMERVSQISQPTIVICGAEDQLTPARYAQFLADKIPGAHLEMIPNAGHMVMLERPNVVAEALMEFLDEIPYYM